MKIKALLKTSLDFFHSCAKSFVRELFAKKSFARKSSIRFLLPPPLTNAPASLARFCKLVLHKSIAKSCAPFVALLCISSLLSFANAYNYIAAASVAGGGKLVANGVDIGWLNFTRGVPLSVSFGGQNRIRTLSVDTNNTIDIMLVGLNGNHLIIDDFEGVGRANIITTIPELVLIQGDVAKDKITINGKSVIGLKSIITAQEQTIINKAYTGAGAYLMNTDTLKINEVVGGVKNEVYQDQTTFDINTGGRENANIEIGKGAEYVRVCVSKDNCKPYAEWKAKQNIEGKNNSPVNDSSSSIQGSAQNGTQNAQSNTNTLLNPRKSYENLSNIADNNTMLIYNMLSNYEGTYLAYDYGLANTISVGAFQNGFFARYYTKNKWASSGNDHGYDIGIKFRSKWTKANLYYSHYYQDSLVATLGLKREFSFNLSDSFGFVLTPSINANYAMTLKKDYIPTNHLGFFTAQLQAGVRLWRTTLLAKAGAGKAYNSLKTISLDNGALSYEPTFINNVYTLGVGINQRLFGGLHIAAEAGYVYLDKQFWESGQLKSGVFRANAMIIYKFRSNRFDNMMGYYDEEGIYRESAKRDRYGRTMRKSSARSTREARTDRSHLRPERVSASY
ncbi:hypothetical protein [Helicobacter sp. MIT 01-3238]|uniref:hypothetical protein n=1 Tax=Helicobacter sp. MIT 01-3238 TaxID=398627 RepID=UPI000E1E3A9A|nr:hypothetical protein [Helicobacter sp. MIT 01-3238]RDU51903.1 hypothetical protein CQA40_08685 [Helicobacter sp. MIT 01-3238]